MSQYPQVTYTLEVEQDDAPVRDNLCCSGDDAYDKEQEDAVLERLNRSDVWAWACVRLVAVARLDEHVSITVTSDWLGGCSYLDERDFIENSGYYDDMKRELDAEISLQLNHLVYTSRGEPFTLDDARAMAKLVHKRFGRDSAATREAWARMLYAPSATLDASIARKIDLQLDFQELLIAPPVRVQAKRVGEKIE